MRIASRASLILRVKETSLVSRKFFATCWVIVEAPCGRLLEPKFCAYTTPGRAQETQKPDQQAHYRSSVPTLCAEICGVYPNTAIPANELPPRGRTIKGPADNIDRFRRPAVDFLYRCRCGQTRAWATGRHAFQPTLTPCAPDFSFARSGSCQPFG